MRQARPYWPHIAGIFLVGLLSAPLTLLTPLPLKLAVDNVLGSDSLPAFLTRIFPASFLQPDRNLLLFTAILIVLIALVGQIQSLADSLLRTYTGEKLTLNFRARLFHHSQRLSLSYHDSRGTSDTAYRIQYDTESLRYVAIDGITPFITAGVTLLSMLYVTFRLDRQLSLVAIAVSPVLFMAARFYRKQLRQKSRDVKKLESASFSVVHEVLAALRVVKAFGQENREQERFLSRSNQTLDAQVHLTVDEEVLGLVLGLTTAIGTATVLYLGVLHVQRNLLTLGDLLLVMGYLAQLYGPLRTISKKVTSLQSHLASAERAFALLDKPLDVPDNPKANSIQRARGAVEFCDVSFRYADDDLVLKDISFSVAPGTRVGIAGMTGAGKSTLMNLLTRFYDPVSGHILLDGIDLRDYKLADLREQFAIVLQETILFSSSVAENIAYARPSATKSEIIQAAQAANAHDFIICLPEGYDTQVGERGMRLSGGERQRIALARAFLKDAPVLILDEPTSSIDMKTESGIMEAMERLMHGRTTFMIAHRLNTLENCNLLLTLKDGELASAQKDVRAVIEKALELGGIDDTLLQAAADV